jgi:putative methionine-R-sulfoxide reductase with GAF domain
MSVPTNRVQIMSVGSASRSSWFRRALAGRTPPWTWLVPAVTIVAAGAVFIGGVLGGAARSPSDWVWLAVAVGGVFVTAGLPFGRDWARRTDQEAGELRVTLRDALQPLAESVAALPSLPPGERVGELGTVAAYGVAALTLVMDGVPGLRSVVYQLDDSGSHMTCLAYHGRGGLAPSDFTIGTARGDGAIALVRSAGTTFVRDLARDRSDTYAGSESGSSTFISVSIHDRENAYGMLTVDAPTPGSLVAVDVHLLEVVADLLAIAFATAKAVD